MEIDQKRRRKIAKAVFDNFVRESVIEQDAIVDGYVKISHVNMLAKEFGCNTLALTLAINNSARRIIGETAKNTIPVEEEDKVMWAVSKTRIKHSTTPLKDLKRSFNDLTAKLNSQVRSLHLKTSELFQYARPIYQEVLDEVCDS